MKHGCECTTHQVKSRCDHHADPSDGPDVLTYYDLGFEEYGLVVRSCTLCLAAFL
jgi:hypothetical protein